MNHLILFGTLFSVLKLGKRVVYRGQAMQSQDLRIPSNIITVLGHWAPPLARSESRRRVASHHHRMPYFVSYPLDESTKKTTSRTLHEHLAIRCSLYDSAVSTGFWLLQKSVNLETLNFTT